MSAERVITRVGVVKAGAGSLLAATFTPKNKRSLLHITFDCGASASTLGMTGTGTGATSFLNSGAEIPAGTCWTGTREVDESMTALDFLVSAAGTYTLLVSEEPR